MSYDDPELRSRRRTNRSIITLFACQSSLAFSFPISQATAWQLLLATNDGQIGPQVVPVLPAYGYS